MKTTHRATIVVLALAVLGLTASCASMNKIEQRTSQGPTSYEMWYMRVVVQNGREPSFDEKSMWRDEMDLKITRWLNTHPEDANSLGVGNLRFERRVVVGMSKEQVLMLLDSPISVTGDEGEMQKLARRYWPMLKGNVTEAWVYPMGWNFYFAGPRLIDITQYLS